MGKDRKKSVNIHSSVLDKQPTPATLEMGELAVNTAPNGVFISTKNSQNKVVRFSEDGTIINWMELKEVFPYEASINGSASDGSIRDEDLWNNKSCINIKLNQIAGVESPHKSDVNGAMDIFNREINPIVRVGGKPVDGGAGLCIDMSPYAMIGANPSFSSVTTTHQSTLSGTTGIYGTLVGDGDQATLNFCDSFSVKSDNISFSSCTSGNGEFTIKTGDVTVGGREVFVGGWENVTVSGTNVGVEARDITVDATFNVGVEAEDACIVGTRKINVYGDTTNIGIDCDETTIASNTVVKGYNALVSGNTTNIEAAMNLALLSYSDIDISGSTICERAGDYAAFVGYLNTYIGMDCSGSSVASDNIVIGRTPKGSQLSATTVDGAIEDAFNRSKVTMTVVEHTPQSEILKTYKLFQDGQQIGQDINIPKDHVLKDARIVYGGFTDISGTFVDCEELGGENCHYYIEFTWNVYDPSTGHADDKVSYLPCDDFIQVVEAYNTQSNGIKTTVTLEDGKYKVSGSTNVSVVYGDNWNYTQTADQTLNDGFKLSAYTLNVNVSNGTPTEHTESYNTFQSGKTINIAVPSSVSHLERGTLTLEVSGGTPTSAFTSYDATDNRDFKVIVPTTLEHLSEYNGTVGGEGCYMFNHDICMTSNTVVAQGFYASSDRNLKENINPIMHLDYHKADNVSFKSFNFKDDETKSKTYGVIAQDALAAGLDEIVHKNADGTLNVDYISLLILKMANLEDKVKTLTDEINQLKGKQ